MVEAARGNNGRLGGETDVRELLLLDRLARDKDDAADLLRDKDGGKVRWKPFERDGL